MEVQSAENSGSICAAYETAGPGHAQAPASHVPPVGQGLSQPPQWNGLVSVSTQAPAHSVRSPQPALQTPVRHTKPGSHGRSQPPQCVPSAFTSTQASPQCMASLGHAQLPASQAMPAGHGESQPPQWAGSLVVSMHAAPPQVSHAGPVSSAVAEPEPEVSREADEDETAPLEPGSGPVEALVLGVVSMAGSGAAGQPNRPSDRVKVAQVFRVMIETL